MATRIAPLLCKEIPSLKWKVKKSKSALDNLQEALAKVGVLIAKLESGKLPVPEQLATKETLKNALQEAGQSISGVRWLAKSSTQKWAAEKDKSLASKSDSTLLREFLRLARNEPKIRSRSHHYEEAWPEVEANYFLKVSLYRTELARRASL